MGNAAPRAQSLTHAESASQYRTFLMDYSPRSVNIVFGSLIADRKFLKSIYCKCEDGSLIVKIYRKYDPNESLEGPKLALHRLSRAFTIENQPNLIPYADYQFSAKFNVAFMVRQYFASNLYDRICSRPFLTHIEKKWIVFQILRALEQCHAKGICHGDIKQENIMVTSWNWIFLTDFAPFKPTYIPEDDPADYNYYFCAIDATRRACSVAPERFYGKNGPSSTSSSASTGKMKRGGGNSSGSNAAAGTNVVKGQDAMMLSRLADSELTVEEVDKQMLSMGGAAGNGGGSTTGSTANTHPRNRREGDLLESMDVFSAGCVIAEVFLGGTPLFDLPSLLRYRRGDPEYLRNALRKIEDPALEEMLLHMLQLDARARSSAAEYLARYTSSNKNSLFPSYFENFLFRFLVLVLSRGGKVPDARIRLVCKYYGRIAKEVAGVDDPEGERFFKLRLREGYGSDRQLNADLMALDEDGHVAQRVLEELDRSATTDANDHGGLVSSQVTDHARTREDDMTLSGTAQKKKIEKLNDQYHALTKKKKQTLTTDYPLLEGQRNSDTNASENQEAQGSDGDAHASSSSSKRSRSKGSPRRQIPWGEDRNGIVIILSLVCSSLRHVQVPESKITALYLLRYLGQYTSDEVRLQRLVPFLLEVVADPSATVRALAIRTLTFLLSLVKAVPLSDASIFPQYILPQMSKFPVDSDELVRITFAECLPLLAATSRRFLEIAHSMKQQSMGSGPGSAGSTPPGASAKANTDAAASTLYLATSNFDKDLNRLHKMVSRFVIQLAAPDQKSSSPLVKRALLVDITRLCIFFGRERTLDVVLPQLITFLNDRDWELRGAFFDHIAGLCAFVGRVTVELYILPCIEQALFDVQEIVITKALESLAALCQLGLFQKSTSALADKARLTCPLLVHPSWWIRDAVLKLMSYIAIQMGTVDANVFLGPLLRPYLKKTMIFLVDESERESLYRLRDCCRLFVSRETFDAALVASSSPTGNLEGMLEMDGFVSSPSEDDPTAKGPREPLSSVDSLDNYPHNRLPPASTAAAAEPNSLSASVYEQKKNELQALKLMKHYVEVASGHMRSKMELARSDQEARMQYSNHGGKNTPAGFGSSVRKLSRSSLHVLYVPDMRFALSVAQPLRGGNLAVASSAAHTTTNSTALVATGANRANASRAANAQASAATLENLSLSLIVKMYGLVAPNLPLAATPMSPVASAMGTTHGDDMGNKGSSHLQPPLDSNHFAPANGAMVSMLSMNTRDAYGGDGVGGIMMDHHHHQYQNHHGSQVSPTRQRTIKKGHQGIFTPSTYHDSSIDPALTNPRKLLARLTALGVPPLPPDLGVLRLSDGSPSSIYAHPSSPYTLLQGASKGVASVGIAAERAALMAANPSAATHASVYSSGGSLPSSVYGTIGGSGMSGSGTGFASSYSSYRNWRPRKNMLVAELAEHSGAVNRIGAAQDFSFLASASNDGTVKLWSIQSMQHSINQGSRCTYDAQGGVLTDMVVLDNCHSVASASSDGSVHVFRVDNVSASGGGNYHSTGLREIRNAKSAITVLDHLNNVTESLLMYATRNGTIHAWDMRVRREAWRLEIAPELGYVTCMTHSMDVNWLAVGTSRGFICLWDLRFLLLIRIWRHSSHRSIHRLKPCLGLPNTNPLEETSVPLVFVAAGDGEVAVFDLSIGACRAIFRTLHVQSPETDACKCPTLLHVPIPHRSRSVLGNFLGIYGIATAFDEIAATPLSEEPSVRAILCPSLHFRGVSDALITGGEDKQIRYWDIRNGKQSFTMCGDTEAKSFYDKQSAPSDWWRMSASTGPGANSSGNHSRGGGTSVRSDALVSAASMNMASTPSTPSSVYHNGSGVPVSKPEMAWSRLSPPLITICQDASYFAAQGGLGAVLAAGGGVESAVTMERRGLVPPSPAHNDCILDLALVDLNGPVLVSSGRDGIIKVWK